MSPRAILAAMIMWIVQACASAPGIDRPVPLETGYAAREASAREPHDRCGPEFIQENLPGPVVSTLGPFFDGPFRPVCERHDACYRLREQTQAWCDDRMRAEMMDICAAGRPRHSAGGALCRMRANLYFASVDNTFGGYAYEGEAGGRIAALDISDGPRNRAKVCVTAENDTPLMQEYIIDLRDGRGRRIARKPRFHEQNVRAGASAVICAHVGERRLRGPVEVSLVADRPDSFATRNDMITVDTRRIDAARQAPD